MCPRWGVNPTTLDSIRRPLLDFVYTPCFAGLEYSMSGVSTAVLEVTGALPHSFRTFARDYRRAFLGMTSERDLSLCEGGPG